MASAPRRSPMSRNPRSGRLGSASASRQRLVGALCLLALLIAVALAAYSRWPRRHDWTALATKHANAAGLDPALVLAVIDAESKGQPRAMSRVGARGLMQLMPATAQEIAQQHGVPYAGPSDLFDPDLNVRLGTLYLARLRRQFGNDPWLYVAAYNAGPGNVDKWRLQHPKLTSRQLIDTVAFPATRAYVRSVLATWRRER